MPIKKKTTAAKKPAVLVYAKARAKLELVSSSAILTNPL
jgi:hypothetical protein